MSDCQACGVPIRPDLEECENCGSPVSSAVTGRRTQLAEGPAPAQGGAGLYRPGGNKGGRRTQIDDADPFPSVSRSNTSPRRSLDPNDPFAVAAQPSSASDRSRRTMIEGALSSSQRAAASPDDPFARALETPPAGQAWPALERPLVGVFITFSGSPNGRVLPLTLGRTDVGRDPGPPGPEVLILDDDSVTSVHAEITAQPGVIWFTDNRSSNGTKIRSVGETEDRLLPPRVPCQLKDGDIVQMGDSILQFRAIDQAAVKSIWSR